jgi:hypothetical protein
LPEVIEAEKRFNSVEQIRQRPTMNLPTAQVTARDIEEISRLQERRTADGNEEGKRRKEKKPNHFFFIFYFFFLNISFLYHVTKKNFEKGGLKKSKNYDADAKKKDAKFTLEKIMDCIEITRCTST